MDEEENVEPPKIITCKPNLVSIHYPGYIKNLDKAIHTLGGIRGIESATSGQKKYLELSFRPENLHRKPLLSDKDNRPQILLKIKTRQITDHGKIISQDVLDYEVVGITAINFKFTKLCDFQYLPLVSKVPKVKEDELHYVYDDIIPKDIPDADWISAQSCKDIPLFIVPHIFSKWNMHGNQLQFDKSQLYQGRFDQAYCEKFKPQHVQEKAAKREKEKLTKLAMLCRIEDDIPQEPSPQSVSVLKTKEIDPKLLDKIKALFDERPIWSRHGIIYHSGATYEQMKHVLPTIAFHYVSGPWRVMWVRFGYDPRVTPEARMLQTFDYRVRSRSGHKIRIKTRKYDSRGYSSDTRFTLSSELTAKTKTMVVQENFFQLRPGLLPAARQTFFQFCDVKLEEIETLLGKLPPVVPGTRCDDKHGWLPNGFTDHCREIVNKYIKEFIQEDVRKTKALENAAKSKEVDLHVSESSSSSSDSESDGEQKQNIAEDNTDTLLDMETVEEINKLIADTTLQLNLEAGPSC